MRTATVLAIVLARLCVTAAAQGSNCPIVPSCSTKSEHRDVNPCCSPSPGGLFVFRQRLQLDEANDLGNWGVDGLDVLECDTAKPITGDASSPAYSHEEIASLCLRSELFGGEKGFAKAEKEWAQAEAGEGVEELWERAWSKSGRYISTLSPQCMESGKESAVPLFFHILHGLQTRYSVAELLADADITPSSDTTYSLSEIEAALGANHNHPIVTCEDGTLSSISWPLIVKGKFQSGDFRPYPGVPNEMKESNCPKEGIKYPSSVHAPAPKPSDNWDPIFRPKPRAITKPHDESRLYNPPSPDTSDAGTKHPLQLGFFKGKDEKRESKEDRLGVQFARDELSTELGYSGGTKPATKISPDSTFLNYPSVGSYADHVHRMVPPKTLNPRVERADIPIGLPPAAAGPVGRTQLCQWQSPSFPGHAVAAAVILHPLYAQDKPSAPPSALTSHPRWAHAAVPPAPFKLAGGVSQKPTSASLSRLPARQLPSHPYGYRPPPPCSADKFAQITEDRRRYKNHNIALKEREEIWKEEKAALKATLQEREAQIVAQATELTTSKLLMEELRESMIKRDVAAKIQCSLLHERMVSMLAEKSKVDLELCQIRHDILASLRMPIGQRQPNTPLAKKGVRKAATVIGKTGRNI